MSETPKPTRARLEMSTEFEDGSTVTIECPWLDLTAEPDQVSLRIVRWEDISHGMWIVDTGARLHLTIDAGLRRASGEQASLWNVTVTFPDARTATREDAVARLTRLGYAAESDVIRSAG